MTDERSLPQPGTLLVGKYRVERLLGKGGMGAVFAAQHELLGQRVAVKLLLSDVANTPEGLQRFLNEARAAARLDSEYVARVMDVGTLETGLPYMVLEYLEGGDLSQALEQRGALPVHEVVDHMLQACEALAQAHAAGIVHRDLKPSNLYLARRQDGSSRVKVLDFGISKVSDHSMTPKALTSTSAMLGTPYYMSPEQFVTPKGVDARTDIWQLGVIMFELLGGAPPFGGETLGQLMYAIMNGPLPTLRDRRPDLPPGLEPALLRCLERDVSRRYANVAELAEAIAPFGTGTQNLLIERMGRTLGVRPGASAQMVAAAPARQGPITGSGPHAPITGSGAVPGVNTANSWGQGSTGAGPTASSSSKAPVIIGASVFGLLTIAGIGVLVTRGHGHPAAGTAASASVVASVAVTAAPPTPSASASAAPAPADTSSAAAGSATSAGTKPSPARPTPPVPGPATAKKTPVAPATTSRPDQMPDNSRQ
jgi:serine/threonine-protein kinase